jgi:hypothetical protein
LAGVVVAGAWYPAHRGISPASDRLIEAGLVEVVALPAFIAPDLLAAIEVALAVAQMQGYMMQGYRLAGSNATSWQKIALPEADRGSLCATHNSPN